MTDAAAPKPLPKYLLDRYRGWKATTFEESRAWYAKLAEEGQRPRAMVIGCCDSRVDAMALFGAEPGELFMVRNVANLVPPYEPSHKHHGTSAALEFAVTSLGITNLLVMGHAHCGGVAGYMKMHEAGPEALGGEFIGNWVATLAPAYERIPAEGSNDERQRALEKAGVGISLENLMTFPFVREAVEGGRLSLHGAWFDIGAGTLHVMEPGGRWSPAG